MKVGVTYQYFEERPYQATRGVRRRDVIAGSAEGMTLSLAENYWASTYTWWRTREFEGRNESDESEGVWPINHCRVYRHDGDPGLDRCPFESRPESWPPNIHEMARQFRLHHYFRVWTSDQCRELVNREIEVRFSFEVTEDWHDPPSGMIEITPGSPILGSHAVPIAHFDGEIGRFVFRNSWGESWGNEGFGAFAPDFFDQFVIEAWCLTGQGIEPYLEAKTGLVCLLWKADFAGQEVHGREIVDAGSGERIAWSFLVRRDSHFEIEEFFVWPTHRRQGHGRNLAELVRQLSLDSGLPLRAWIPFADASFENREAVMRLLELLGLELRPSPHRSAAFLATPDKYDSLLIEPRMPARPASVRERLNPIDGTRLYPVWFGTNRKPVAPGDLSQGFLDERDNCVHFGVCKVAIPKSHRFGSLGSSWWRRWLRWTDDRLSVVERSSKCEDDFWNELAKYINDCGENERQCLVFLHGYNVDFDEAAIRAAQIGFDLKVPGLTAFFSWPSCGTVFGYAADEATIDASEHFIADFLRDFVARSGATRVHLVAHSMGNRGLTRALHRLAASMNGLGMSFGQIILAAPDIDCDLFTQLAEVFPRVGQRTTLYASRKDWAIQCSQWLHKYTRAGLTPPVTIVRGVDTVEVPKFNILDLGHGYYAEAEALLYDMFDLMRRNAPPSERQRLFESRDASGAQYWIMNQ